MVFKACERNSNHQLNPPQSILFRLWFFVASPGRVGSLASCMFAACCAEEDDLASKVSRLGLQDVLGFRVRSSAVA